LELDDFMMKVKNEKAVSTYRDYLCTMKVLYLFSSYTIPALVLSQAPQIHSSPAICM